MTAIILGKIKLFPEVFKGRAFPTISTKELFTISLGLFEINVHLVQKFIE